MNPPPREETRMQTYSFQLAAIARVLKYFPLPGGRYGRRYRFYQRVKNTGFVLPGRLRHSGLVLPLDLGDWVQYWMFMDGAYERELVDFLLPRVEGKTFFDVGANVGSYTLSFAKSAARIYSFEASASNCRILRSFMSSTHLPRIEIVNKAVSNSSGQNVSLFCSPDTGGNHSQFCDYGNGHETCTTISIDDFARERGILDKVHVMKVDIEGSEFAAFEGAHELLAQSRPLLLVELNALMAARAGWMPNDLHSLLSDYGYVSYELVRSRLAKFDTSRLNDPELSANLIFVHGE